MNPTIGKIFVKHQKLFKASTVYKRSTYCRMMKGSFFLIQISFESIFCKSLTLINAFGQINTNETESNKQTEHLN